MLPVCYAFLFVELARPSHATLSAVIAVCHSAYYVYSFPLTFGWLHYFHYSSHVSIKQPITIGSVAHGTYDDSKFNWQKNLLMFSSLAPNQLYKCVYKCFHSLSEDTKQRTQAVLMKPQASSSCRILCDFLYPFVIFKGQRNLFKTHCTFSPHPGSHFCSWGPDRSLFGGTI